MPAENPHLRSSRTKRSKRNRRARRIELGWLHKLWFRAVILAKENQRLLALLVFRVAKFRKAVPWVIAKGSPRFLHDVCELLLVFRGRDSADVA